jgi:hypothetical protein
LQKAGVATSVLLTLPSNNVKFIFIYKLQALLEMKKNIIFLVLILLVPMLLYILSLETVIPIPLDENHLKITEEQVCFNCHGEGEEYALKKEHPPKYECFKCHKIEQASGS